MWCMVNVTNVNVTHVNVLGTSCSSELNFAARRFTSTRVSDFSQSEHGGANNAVEQTSRVLLPSEFLHLECFGIDDQRIPLVARILGGTVPRSASLLSLSDGG